MIEKQKSFLDFLFGEARGNAREAMRMAGYSDSTNVTEVTGPLSKEIEERTRRFIADSGPKAVFSMMDILEGKELLGVKEKIMVAKDFLDRAGISKTEKIEVESKSPVFFLPAKKENDDEDE